MFCLRTSWKKKRRRDLYNKIRYLIPSYWPSETVQVAVPARPNGLSSPRRRRGGSSIRDRPLLDARRRPSNRTRRHRCRAPTSGPSWSIGTFGCRHPGQGTAYSNGRPSSELELIYSSNYCVGLNDYTGRSTSGFLMCNKTAL